MRTPAAGIAVIALLTTASPLSFAVSRPHNGAFCQKSGVVYGPQFGVHVVGGAATTVICPVQRDQGQTWNLLKRVRVNAYDRHSTANVTCTLNALGQSGVLLFQTSTLSTSGATGPVQAIEWLPNIGLDHQITLTITCSIPPPENNAVSHVASYLIIEE